MLYDPEHRGFPSHLSFPIHLWDPSALTPRSRELVNAEPDRLDISLQTVKLGSHTVAQAGLDVQRGPCLPSAQNAGMHHCYLLMVTLGGAESRLGPLPATMGHSPHPRGLAVAQPGLCCRPSLSAKYCRPSHLLASGSQVPFLFLWARSHPQLLCVCVDPREGVGTCVASDVWASLSAEPWGLQGPAAVEPLGVFLLAPRGPSGCVPGVPLNPLVGSLLQEAPAACCFLVHSGEQAGL